jgi:hypothetical protein
MKVFIASRGRAYKQISLQTFPDAAIVVPTYEVKAYKTANPDTEIVGCKDEGIAKTRQFILEELCGGKKFLMLDDDIVLYKRGEEPGKFTKLKTPEEVEPLRKELSAALDTYAHAGVAMKWKAFREPRGHRVGAKYGQLFAINPELFPDPPPRFDRCRVNEELDFELQLCAAGHFNMLLTEWAEENVKTYAEGGCSVWRTAEEELKGLQEFAALWPHIIKVRKTDAMICGYKAYIRWPNPNNLKRGPFVLTKGQQ